MKKLVFVMVAVLNLMFVSCKTTPASTSDSNLCDSLIEEVDSTAKVDSTVVEDATKTPAVEVKKSSPEVKEGADVTTPAKPVEEANKPIGNKK